MTDSIALSPGEVALLLASTGDGSACKPEMLGPSPAGEVAMLLVTLNQPPQERLDRWRSQTGALPAEASIIYASDRPEREVGDGDLANYHVRIVRNPANLTRLGVTITEELERLRETGKPIVVCFHSLSILLQYADTDQVFRFLRVLNDHLKHADAVSHVHLDPAAHDEQTIATLKQVFDTVISE